MASDLSSDFEMYHFQVGSEGRHENFLRKTLRVIGSPFELAAFLVRTRVELVHLNTSLNARAYWRDLVYMLVAKALRRKVVNQVHGGARPDEFFSGSAVLTSLLRFFLQGSDVVAVLSARELDFYKSFEPGMNVRLVPNAIDVGGLADGVRGYNLNAPLNLVYVGRIVRAKGLFEIIEALEIVKRSGRRFLLSIAGSGPDAGAMADAIRRAGLADSVRFLGGVFGHQKDYVWLESDVLVFPSHSEGLPYSLLEAMAAGCVPIITPVGAVPEVARDGEHGLIVPINDVPALASAIIKIDDDRESLKRMAEAGRKRILEHYTLPRLAADFRDIYAQALRQTEPEIA